LPWSRNRERAAAASAIAPIATESLHCGNRRFGPKGDIAAALFDYLVGAQEE
jgi:hypothetical protein